jgi:hypothetical protein
VIATSYVWVEPARLVIKYPDAEEVMVTVAPGPGVVEITRALELTSFLKYMTAT